MDNKTLLVKSITLLYKESLLGDQVDRSIDMVRTVLDNVQPPAVNLGINTEAQITHELKEIALEMCRDEVNYEYDKATLLQRFKLIPDIDDRLLEALVSGLDNEIDEANLKRSVTNLKKNLTNHFREQQIDEILGKAAAQFRHRRDQIKDINQFIGELCSQLEPLQMTTSQKDPAVIDDIDIGDEGMTTNVFNSIMESGNGNGVLKTGWIALNKALQGGFWPGKEYGILALQHSYKTGVTLSLFKQIALYNTPYMKDPNKKPLLLRISFEDEAKDNLQFLYQALRKDLSGQKINLADFSAHEMSDYVRECLQINGFHIRMLRVDPTQWTYKNICNKVIELEAQGYEIKLLMLDYLSKIPTTGCTQGPAGTDLRDLFQRIRSFCAPKEITVITPHQLSTEAKGLLRTGVPPQNFVKEIAGKGYYEGSKQIDQVLDGEIYIHKFTHGSPKETYLAFQVGKHRLPTIAPEEDKYFLLKFPKWTPIPDDVDTGEDSSFKKPGQHESDDSLFSGID